MNTIRHSKDDEPASQRRNSDTGNGVDLWGSSTVDATGSCCVVGGSRSGRGCACEGGRSAGRDRSKERPGEFRAIIGAEKRGNARGAKGGRKAERRTNRQGHDIRNRLLLGARTPKTTTVCPGGEYLSAEAIGNHRWPGVESWTPTVELSVLLREANCRLESRVREIRSHGSEGGAA